MIHHETVIMETRWFLFEEYETALDIEQMRTRVQKFVASKKEAAPIELKNLRRYKTAWFEHGHPNCELVESLSHVLTGWTIRGNELIAIKIWRHNGEMQVEQRKYPMENYGKTWRCWTGVPTRLQRERTAWPHE